MADPTGGMRRTGAVTAMDSWLLKKFIRAIGNPPVVFVLWDGTDVCASDAEPVGRVVIHDRKTFMHMLLNPNLGFGDGFAVGAIEVEGDLVTCLEALLRAMPVGADTGVLARLTGLLPKTHANTPAGSRANIRRHYDIGNDFYRLWLDEELVYTCAYYTSEADTLEAAQIKKMHHVCRK
ncbi:MAG: class I SAM-dependent methyltransferase, partial [Mariprofundaceae bacterium]|nr:class I SAM-dependent methyltransferase [Mariprofundaceae bacterium]